MISNKRNEAPRVISLFAGCGGLDLGFHRQGYHVVWANDFNEWAAETYKKNLGDVMHCGDIEKVAPYKSKSIPGCDLVLGGFPCQYFSMIWKRPGLNGERGNLYKSFLRFVDAKKPKAFIADFQYPKTTNGPKARRPYFTAGEALKGVEKVKINNERMNASAKTIKMLELIPDGGNFADIPKNHPLYVKGMTSHVYRRITRNEPAKTIIAAGGGGTWGYHYPESRPLTNRERARLQSFPDSFEFIGSYAEIRRQIGNAVQPQGVAEVAKALMPLFKGDYNKVDLHAYYSNVKNQSVKKRIEYDCDEITILAGIR